MYYKTITFAASAMLITALRADCTVEQSPSGEWQIICEGDGLVVDTQYVTVTNTVFADRCEEIKLALSNAVNTVSNQLADQVYQFDQTRNILLQYEDQYGIEGMGYTLIGYDRLNPRYVQAMVDGGYGYDQFVDVPLRRSVDEISCATCPNGGEGGGESGGSCCPDFTPILESLYTIQSDTHSISNTLADYTGYLVSITNSLIQFQNEYNANAITNNLYWNRVVSLGVQIINYSRAESYYTQFRKTANTRPITVVNKSLGGKMNIAQFGYLPTITWGIGNIEDYLISLNNGLYFQTTNIVDHIDKYGDYLVSSTSHNSPLVDYVNQNQQGSKYAYLTNYYLTVIDSSEPEKTNWFHRVETLLAALVFNDGTTNAVVTATENTNSAEKQQLQEGLGSINDSGQTALSQFTSSQNNALSLLRQYGNQFADASLPQQVRLLQIRDDSTGEYIDITFATTDENMQYYEICRAVTTLAWVMVGLFLLYRLLVWSIGAVVHIVAYCYEVICGIFK